MLAGCLRDNTALAILSISRSKKLNVSIAFFIVIAAWGFYGGWHIASNVIYSRLASYPEYYIEVLRNIIDMPNQ
jgi:hypothetical protein